MTELRPTGIQVVDEVPAGYRGLHDFIRESDKAALFNYYDHRIWLPKSAIREVRRPPQTIGSADQHWWAQAWAVDSAIAYERTRET